MNSTTYKAPVTPDELFDYAENLGHGELHIKMDPKTGLRTIISIHNTNRGPALGGCRFLEYDHVSDAVYDAMRLARGMTYKSAISNLPLGGGKAVIIKPKKNFDRRVLFEAFGAFVNELGGRYITAVDSGTSVSDMDIINRTTPYVTSTTRPSESHGDPSFSTALGVFESIKVIAKHQLSADSLKGIRVAIQGAGHVGYILAKHLHNAGAKIFICDKNMEAVKRCVDEFNAVAVAPDDIYTIECDIFSPCALGAILNTHTIPKLKCKIVAGSANNQLQNPEHAQMLADHQIFYVPDYVINAGGIIDVCWVYYKETEDRILTEVKRIADTVALIAEQSKTTGIEPSIIADQIALQRLGETP